MPECYTCGCWIDRGAGVRARVTTGTSTRYYATRSGGASFGVATGLRTICRACAHRQSADEDSGRIVAFIWFVGLPLGVWAAASVNFAAGVVVGLVIPAIASWLTIWGGRKDAEERLSSTPGIPHPPRVMAAKVTSERKYPPATPKYATSAEWLAKPSASHDLDPTSWHEDDTHETWARRASIILGERYGTSSEALREHAINLSRWCTPKVGEGFRHWHTRAQQQISKIDINCDRMSPASAIRPDESHRDWLIRISLLCVPVGDTGRLDDLVEALEPIAKRAPPQIFEFALDWFERERVNVEATVSRVPGFATSNQ